MGLILTCILIFSSFLYPIHSKAAQNVRLEDKPNVGVKVFIPLLARPLSSYIQKIPFGATIDSSNAAAWNKMAAANTGWTRLLLTWSTIESTEGTLLWSNASLLENQMAQASTQGMQIILVIQGTPAWAIKSGFACGAVTQGKFSNLQAFISSAVQRYSGYPYNVHYWELWNEPDVYNAAGCWGDPNETYYGGTYYAEMLKQVYQTFKAVDPLSKVMVGGLLLDCDPRLTSCPSGRFLEGILRNSGGSSLDGISFHAFDYYWGAAGVYANPAWNSAWNNNGPVVLAKTNFILSLINDPAFGASNKFLMNTQGAVICDSCDATSTNYLYTEVYYIPQLYAATLAMGLSANLWPNVMGWRGSKLLNSDLSSTWAYIAYQLAGQKLGNATFVSRKIANGIVRYDFIVGQTYLTVVWSADGGSHTINLPAYLPGNFSNVSDPLGINEIVLNNTVNLTLKPLYIE